MELVSKTDVLIGVHGNGLTNEIWMKPGGAVLESELSSPSRSTAQTTRRADFFLPLFSSVTLLAVFDIGGFTRDYQIVRTLLISVDFPSNQRQKTTRRTFPFPILRLISLSFQQLTEPLHHIYLPIWNDTVYDWAADAPGALPISSLPHISLPFPLLSPAASSVVYSADFSLSHFLFFPLGFKLSDHFAGTNLVVSANLVRDLVVDLVKEGGKVDRNRNTWMVVNSSRV